MIRAASYNNPLIFGVAKLAYFLIIQPRNFLIW